MPKDFFGNELETGDSVVYIKGSYRDFTVGEIVKLNPCKATIKLLTSKYPTVRYYHQIIKVKGEN